MSCFSIQPDGKTVFLDGIIENESFFGIPPGSGAAFFHCQTGTVFTNIPPTPIQSGNISVNQ